MADEFDPATAEVKHTEDLRAIAAVSEAVRADEAQLREAVEVAPGHTKGHGTRSVGELLKGVAVAWTKRAVRVLFGIPGQFHEVWVWAASSSFSDGPSRDPRT